MKTVVLVVMSCLCSGILRSQNQNAAVAIEAKPHALQERYQLMKVNSQTFQDYKVIKEFILDGVWKIGMDSLNKREAQLAQANEQIRSLQKDLAFVQANLKTKEDSMADIQFASSHIHVIGINFSKSSFLAINAVSLITLLLVIGILIARMRAMHYFVNESNLIITSITHELEDFKRSALEKQTKLSRELQTERNRVVELSKGIQKH